MMSWFILPQMENGIMTLRGKIAAANVAYVAKMADDKNGGKEHWRRFTTGGKLIGGAQIWGTLGGL